MHSHHLPPTQAIELACLSQQADQLAAYWHRRGETTLGAANLANLPPQALPQGEIYQLALRELRQITQVFLQEDNASSYLHRFQLRMQRWHKINPSTYDRAVQTRGLLGINALESYLLAQKRTIAPALQQLLPEADSQLNASLRLHGQNAIHQRLPAIRSLLALDYSLYWDIADALHDAPQPSSFSPWHAQDPQHPWPDVPFSRLLWVIWNGPILNLEDVHAMPIAEQRDNFTLQQHIHFEPAEVPAQQANRVLSACLRHAAQYTADRLAEFNARSQNLEAACQYVQQQATNGAPWPRSLYQHLKTLARFARNRQRHAKKAAQQLNQWQQQYKTIIIGATGPTPSAPLQAIAQRKNRIDAAGQRWQSARQWIQQQTLTLEQPPVLEIEISCKAPAHLAELDDVYQIHWDGCGQLSEHLTLDELLSIETLHLHLDWTEQRFLDWASLKPTELVDVKLLPEISVDKIRKI